MDYETKYKEILETVRKAFYSQEIPHVAKAWLLTMFPALVENENEKIRRNIIELVKQSSEILDKQNQNNMLAWLEKQGERKPVSITDEWIEDYWQHEKVINPYSYDKGEEIQFDHRGFVKFCKNYCKKPVEWSEDDERILREIKRYIKEQGDKPTGLSNGTVAVSDMIAWLEKQSPKENNVNEETNAPTAYGKYVDKCLNEAAKHFFSEGEDKYTVADLFYAGVRCGQSWPETQAENKFNFSDLRIWKYIVDMVLTENDGIGNYLDNPDTERIAKKLQEKYGNIEKQDKKPQGKTASEAAKEERVDNQNCVKCADKVEPKFHVGNWYQCTKDFFGKGVTFDKNTAYYCAKEGCLQNEYGCHIAIVKDLYDNFKLWSIEDAKDGDVLEYKDCTFIFKKTKPSDIVTNIKNPLTVLGYCGINRIGFVKSDGWGDTANCKYYPATKEQRELLFSKMKEAGYEWDGEKKELKKIESKFHPGDWIVDDKTPNDVFCVIEVLGEIYRVIDTDGDDYHIPHCKADKQFHLWTINDAKDGDVLACCDNKPFIFKGFFGLNFPNCLEAYCGITLENQFRHCNGKTFWTNQDVIPSTKEQRDLLFQKMADEGYEWDGEKKKLKKMEVASKGNEDEKIREHIIELVKQSSEILDKQNQKEMLVWLEKQGHMLDPDKAIEWFRVNWWDNHISDPIDKFKKDFGL